MFLCCKGEMSPLSHVLHPTQKPEVCSQSATRINSTYIETSENEDRSRCKDGHEKLGLKIVK